MILKDWLKKNNIKPYVFAKSIGMASATIYKNLSGEQRTSSRFAVIIEEKTKGEVSRTEAIWPECQFEEYLDDIVQIFGKGLVKNAPQKEAPKIAFRRYKDIEKDE